jgi:arylsulfatase A-like enzyme
VIRVPMIVYDPSAAADATRGQVDGRFVEAIDVIPTVLDALALPPARHRLEGRSLLELTRGTDVKDWRDAVFCELDYAFRQARRDLGRAPDECRAWMVRTARWKYVEWQGMRPQLFDLASDPAEFRDLGAEPRFEKVRQEMRDRLLDWLSRCKRRTTVTLEEVEARTASHQRAGVFFGRW